MAEEVQLVIFTLKVGETVCEYGVPITQVQEIIRLVAPTRLPQVPDFVEGIINLRGSIIPIVDLKKRFGMAAGGKQADEARVIVVQVEGQTVGIVVDEVAEVLRIATGSIEPPPTIIGGITAEYLTGVGKVDNRLLVLLDMDRILSEVEKKKLEDFGRAATG